MAGCVAKSLTRQSSSYSIELGLLSGCHGILPT